MVSQPAVRRLIGITGAIATGKSTVVRMLAELGAATIDADTVYHDLIAPGQHLHQALVQRWGPGIIAEDGTIDRQALGMIVFSDAAELAALDTLTHPAVVAEVLRQVSVQTADTVVVDAVKLIESGLADRCDSVWLVTCDLEIQRQRLVEHRGLSQEDADARLASQPPLRPRLDRADVVIDNSGDIVTTKEAVHNAWLTMQTSL